MERESLAVLLAQGWSVEKIATRFGKHASTISYWMRKHELEAPNRDKHAAKGGLDHGALQAMVESGMTLAEIADCKTRSPVPLSGISNRYTHAG